MFRRRAATLPLPPPELRFMGESPGATGDHYRDILILAPVRAGAGS